MKKTVIAASLAAIAILPAMAQTPAPAPTREWTTIVMTADVARPADVTWDRIGGKDFCSVIKYTGTPSCTFTAGSGEIGTIRLLGGTNSEMMVSKTDRSYTYGQFNGPLYYHGSLAVLPVDAGHARIVYTLIYDAASLGTDAAKAEDKEKRRVRFQGVIDKMKAVAEAG